jgi:adhesin/invasin
MDQHGNPVTGATVTFVADLGSVLSPRTTTNGFATSQISSTVAGTAHITATSGTAQGTATVMFTPGTAAALALRADPPSQVVGETSALTATVTDQYGNPVTGASVTLVSDLGSVLSPRTTANGIATSQISSTAAGIAHIAATSGAAQGTATVMFIPGTASGLALQADPPSRVVGKVAH